MHNIFIYLFINQKKKNNVQTQSPVNNWFNKAFLTSTELIDDKKY